MFQPFKDVDFLRYGPSMQQKWQTAKKQFEYLLQPAELTVASRLKKQLSGMNNIRQVRNTRINGFITIHLLTI